MTQPSELPERVDGGLVVFDVEASGLFPDDGARISIVSAAYAVDGQRQTVVFPFDQGPVPGKPGAGPASLFDDERCAPNLGIEEWDALCGWLKGKRLVGHNVLYDVRMMRAGLRGVGHGVD